MTLRWLVVFVALLSLPVCGSGCLRALTRDRDLDRPRIMPKRPTNPHYVGAGLKKSGEERSERSVEEATSTASSGREEISSPYAQQKRPVDPTPVRLPAPKFERLPEFEAQVGLEVPVPPKAERVDKEKKKSTTQTVERRAPRKVEPIVQAMEALLEDHHEAALKHLKQYDSATESISIRLLPPLTLLTKKPLDELAPKEIAALTEQLESLLDTLRPHTKLRIREIHFCEWIRSFGVYKPLDDDHVFLASRKNEGKTCPGELVQLYVELDNVGSERHKDYHVTRLSSSVEIRNDKGERIWFYRFDDRKQPIRARSLLHDYYNNYSFYVPHIPTGTYTLTIRVADETFPKHRRTAERSLQFRVNSVPRVSGRL